MLKSLKLNKILSLIIFTFIIVFISNPTIYMKSTLNGLNVWFYNVLPALLPFFISTRLLIFLSIENVNPLDKFTKKFFKVNNGGKIFLLSIISGYPVGAKLICDAYKQKQIDLVSAKKMMAFCSVSGPMFIIGSIGVGVFNSVKIGYILLLCHILGAILNGLIFRNNFKNSKDEEIIQYEARKSSNNILADSMLDSIISILLVGGYIVFAFVLIDLLNNVHLIPSLAHIINSAFKVQNIELVNSALNGCFEMTRGLINIGNLNLNVNLNICISSFLIAFGGISIFLQSLNFTKELKIKKSYFLFQKFCQGLLTLFVSIIFCLIF